MPLHVNIEDSHFKGIQSNTEVNLAELEGLSKGSQDLGCIPLPWYSVLYLYIKD